jgi:8-oxo-dGTP diphosphatase
MKYCVGYLFNDDGSKLALILKQHPAWQKGKWNGIGGKLELLRRSSLCEIHEEIIPSTTIKYPDQNREYSDIDYRYETPYEAMVREFREETGVEFHDWIPFAVTHGPSEYDLDNWEVHYFKGFSSMAQNKIRWVDTTDEIPVVFPLNALPTNLVPHNNWLIPMSLNSDRRIFHITEEGNDKWTL